MPPILIYAFFFVLVTMSSCQSKYNDHIDLHLKGQVKELRMKRYKVENRGGEWSKGRLVSRTLDQPQIYEYEGLPANSRVLFNAQKEITTVENYNNQDELYSRILFKDTIFEMYSGDTTWLANVVVDDRWSPSSIKVYAADGALLGNTIITYHDPEHPLDRTHEEYNQEGELAARAIYKYDDQERLIVVDNTVFQQTHFHIKEEHTIESISYDEHNHPKQVTLENGPNIKVIDITYLLDEHNNWVQSIESIKGKPSRWIERTLVYY